MKKPPSKVAHFSLKDFFPYCQELPKWPKLFKNSFSQIWLIEQLYIELGSIICIEWIDISPTIPEIMYRVLNVTNQNNAHSMILPTDYGRRGAFWPLY